MQHNKDTAEHAVSPGEGRHWVTMTGAGRNLPEFYDYSRLLDRVLEVWPADAVIQPFQPSIQNIAYRFKLLRRGIG